VAHVLVEALGVNNVTKFPVGPKTGFSLTSYFRLEFFYYIIYF